MKTLMARDVCTTDYLCVDGDGHPREILDKMKDLKISACAVFENSTFLGLVDFKDILQTNPQRIFADLLPQSPPPAVQEQAPIEEVSRVLDHHPGSALPVFDADESFVGVVSQESLLQVLLEKHNHLSKLMEKMQDLVHEINRTQDLNPLLRAALRKTLEILGRKTGWILLYNNEKNSQAKLVTHANLPARYLKNRRPQGEARGPVVLTGSCSCQREVLEQKEKSATLCLKGGSELKYHITVPLVSSGKLLGIMNLAYRESRFRAGQEDLAISNEELDLLTTLGKSIGTAITNAQSFHKLEADRERLARQSQRLGQLHKASTHLLSLLGSPLLEERLLQDGIESICQLVEARYGAVGLFNPKGELVKFFHTGLTEEEKNLLKDLPKGKGVLGIIEGENRTLRFRDLTKHPRYYGFPLHHPVMKSFLGVPISLKGQAYGRIYLTEKVGGQPFTREDEKVVSTFARSLALALENAQLMQRLILSETKYRTLFEEAPVMYVITHNQEGVPIVVDCNELFLGTLGYTRAEVLERPLADFYTPESRAELLEGGGYQQALEGHFIDQERELLTRDGLVVKTLLCVVPETDSDDSVFGTRATYVDITERKLAEEALQESEEKQRMILGNINEIVYMVSTTKENPYGGAVQFVSHQVENIIGYQPNKFLDDPALWFKLLHPDDIPTLKESTRKILASKKGGSREYRLRHKKTGEFRWMEDRVVPQLDDSGDVVGIFGVARDITERKIAENILRENENRRKRQNKVLVQLAESKTLEAHGLNAALKEITEAAASTLEVERVNVWLYNEDHSKIHCIDHYELGSRKHSKGFELTAVDYVSYFKALEEERIIAAHDAHVDPRTKEFSESYLTPLGITSMLDAPIRQGTQIVGVVCLEHVGPLRQWRREEQHFAGSLADFISLAMEAHEHRQAEQALQESEERYRQLVENTPNPIFSVNRAGIIQTWNRACEKVFQYGQNIIGTKYRKLLRNPKDSPAIESMLTQIFQGHTVSEVDISYRCKDGSERNMVCRLYPLLDHRHKGRVKACVIANTDITERKRAEEEIRLLQTITQAINESRDFHSALEITVRTVCDSTSWSFGEAWIPSEDGQVLECSSSWSSNTRRLEKFRRLSEEFTFSPGTGLPGRVWSSKQTEWISDVSSEPETSFLRTQIAREAGLKAGLGVPIIAGEQVLAVLVFFMFESREQNEKLVGMISAVASQLGSVIQRKRAEEALKDSEEQYRQLVERVPDGIYRSTPDGQFLAVNSALVKMLGYDSQEELLKISIPRNLYFSPEERDEVLKRIEGDKSKSDIYRLKKKDGEELWVEDHGLQVSDAHGRPIYEGVLRDITERKQLEEQLRQSQKLEAVGQLTGGIAHDFNNLLTVILGNAEFGLQDSKPGDPVCQDLTRIEKAASQARDLISQLMSFSRRQVLEPKVLDLNQTVEDLLKMLKRLIRQDIELKTNLAPKLAPIYADPIQIQQVLMNLFVNARDSMPKGGQLTLETSNLVADPDFHIAERGDAPPSENKIETTDFVQITVTDTGHGMDKETQARIFDPFFTTKEVGEGTGLGLAVVYGIIKQHGGHIEVFSQTGKGTTFKLYFPAVSKYGEEQKKSQRAPLCGGEETILLVEDDEAVRNVALRLLRRLGYEILTAKDGKEAIKLFEAESEKIDLVMMDVVMPKMSGPDTYKKLSLIKPDVLVLFVTGYDVTAQIDELEYSEQAPVNLLQKPYTQSRLAKKVREALDRPVEKSGKFR